MNFEANEKLKKRYLLPQHYRVLKRGGKYDVETLNGVPIEDQCRTEDDAWLRALNDWNAAPRDRQDPKMRSLGAVREGMTMASEKRVVKLDGAGLKKLIVAEVKKLRENMGDPGEVGGDVVLEMIEVWAKSLTYHPDDPSMSAMGEEVWTLQVDAACEELAQAVGEAVEKVEERLINGEFTPLDSKQHR